MSRIEQFTRYLKIDRGYSDNTIESYKRELKMFEEYTGKKFEEVDRATLDIFLKYAQEKYARNTYVHLISAFKSYNKFLKEQYDIYNMEIDFLQTQKMEKKLPKYLTDEQIHKLLDSLTDVDKLEMRNKALIEVMYSTGMRVNEIINVKMHDVNIDNQTIKVYGKGRKERYVFLNLKAARVLQKYIYDSKVGRINLVKNMSDYLFLNNKGGQLTRQGVNFILQELSKRVGIDRISPHMLRHSIASHMLNNGADLRTIQMILGHENISTTEVYTHVNKEHIATEYTKHNIFNKRRKKDE